MLASRNTPKTVKIVIFVIFFLLIVVYSYFALKDIVTGSELTINTPLHNSTVNTSLIVVEGKAVNISFIYLNGRQIFTDEVGFFSEQLLLYSGYNIITITVKDRVGRATTEKIRVIYKSEI